MNKFIVAIIDFGMGNLFSIQNTCSYIGLNSIITSNPKVAMNADALILPGVGAFGEAMNNLSRLDLILPIRDFISSGKPFMGICLGLQLLFTESEEFENHNGLNVVRGVIKRFSFQDNSVKIPHVGWNQIFIPKEKGKNSWDTSLLKGLKDGTYMYFVHSYYPSVFEQEEILTVTNYAGFEYSSGIIKDNVHAFQFHPEKSGENGINIYRNFKLLVEQGAK